MMARMSDLGTDMDTIAMVFHSQNRNNEPFFTKLGILTNYTFTKTMSMPIATFVRSLRRIRPITFIFLSYEPVNLFEVDLMVWLETRYHCL